MSQKDRFNLILQEVAKSGRQWDEVIPYDVLADASFADFATSITKASDILWQGSLRVEDRSFVLQGIWQINVPRHCGRCNTVFAAKMNGDVLVNYQLGEAEQIEQAELELNGDEPEVLTSGELNVLDVLREHFWLAWQPLVVCSGNCKGLCLQCGVDLNQGSCDCHKKVKENAFAALKNLKFDA